MQTSKHDEPVLPHTHDRAMQRFALLPHSWPHEPQLATSVVTFVQALAQHASLPAHVRPHAPQLATELVVSTQLPPQHALPAPQLACVPH
jgi:hypothetical protein